MAPGFGTSGKAPLYATTAPLAMATDHSAFVPYHVKFVFFILLVVRILLRLLFKPALAAGRQK